MDLPVDSEVHVVLNFGTRGGLECCAKATLEANRLFSLAPSGRSVGGVVAQFGQQALQHRGQIRPGLQHRAHRILTQLLHPLERR